MLVVLAIAAAAVLVCVVLVSLGKGGELTEFPPDIPPLELPEPGQLSAVDFMALQLPVNLVGYHTQSVDETLRRAANAISARDTRIAVLEQRVSELLSSRLQARQEVHAGPGDGLRTQHEPRPSDAPLVLSEAEPAVRGLGIEPYGRHASEADPETSTEAEPAGPDEDATVDSEGEARDEPQGTPGGAAVSDARSAGKSRWDDEPDSDHPGPDTAATDTVGEHDERVSAEDRR
ncbi:hypothetical protein [Nonomuraea soli]|uniref:DivIVA domain-containing protein n=1 Tax=Nonomuraea soli TaxID=1032476 RepID=A0A7W0CRD5_9ACTN|nr:hypothetical protein [Nonomuraea soli]MBA2895799.1 hypothetical protein [Nonomuraea soli]